MLYSDLIWKLLSGYLLNFYILKKVHSLYSSDMFCQKMD